MANGDLIKLGTFYLNGAKQVRPTYPWQNNATPTGAPGAGNIPNYSSGNIEIKNTDADDAYKINWIEVNDAANNKKLLIADRNLLVSVSWDVLNAQGLISGKTITIDGQSYLLRVMTGGSNYRSGTDSYSGGTPTNNEWDRIITNEAAFSGLPSPNSTDLDTTQNETDRLGTHNTKWNWYYCYSWVQETFLPNSSFRVIRGFYSARYLSDGSSSSSYSYVGWRPVLEVLNTAPLISDSDGNLGNYAAALKKTYTVTDAENDTINVVEKLDGTTIRTLSNQASGTSLTLDLTSEWSSLGLASHTIVVQATDSKGAVSTRTWTFTKTNSAPGAPTINNPVNLMRVPQNFDVVFTTSTDAEGDTQTLKLEIADDSGFTQNAQTITTGLKKYNDTSKQWEDVSSVTNSDNGKSFKFSVTGITVSTSKYLRIGSTDGGSNTTAWSSSIQVKIGNVLEVATLPSEVDFMPLKINVIDKKTIDSKATVKVFACNNALDASPTWEEITSQYQNNQSYEFTNKTKTADKWSISVKYEIVSNDAVGEISIDAIGVGVS
ncbi:hypothetical protein [Clostridium carboxidivorans]|uniref:hypothetical protein n=1 Tax=Clostridium carboxidivorans TaxID=217159 RepID=UPI00069E77DB|nr:hypothetical protein [Clostridium carboxidivorans]